MFYYIYIYIYENVVTADRSLCDNSTFTFYSDAHSTVSWLDHVVVSSNLFNAVNAIRVDHGFVTSDHFPVSLLFDLSSIRVDCSDNYTCQPNIPWDNLSHDNLSKYSNVWIVTLNLLY